jgi:hypothetical protein
LLEYKPIIDPINGPPQCHIGIILSTTETFSITGPIPKTITINNSTYIYCGVSDTMAYYKIKPLFNHFQPINPSDDVNKHWCINCLKHISLHAGDPIKQIEMARCPND